MLKFFRIVALVAAAGLFGAAQAACACARYETAHAIQADKSHDGAGHSSHHRQPASHTQTDISQTASHHDCGNGGAPCEHHGAQDLAAKASFATSLKAPSQSLLVALVTEAPSFPARKRDAGIHSSNPGWLPPPGPSPVSLKTRLLN